MEKKEICAKCPTKHCCQHPPMYRKDFARIQKYLPHPIKIKDIGKGMITFPYDQCPFLGESGCIVPVEERPLLCLYFPFQFVKTTFGNPIIMLDIGFCPMWKEWGEFKDEAYTFWKNQGMRDYR